MAEQQPKLTDYSKYNKVTLQALVYFLTNSKMDPSSKIKYLDCIKSLKQHLIQNPSHPMLTGPDSPSAIYALLDQIVSDHEK